MTTSITILGSSGYVGGELIRLVDGHPGLETAVPVRPVFTPHLVPMQRGILTTIYAPTTAGTAVLVCAIGNLVNGAAGQAVQAANLMLGLDETAGLPIEGWMP